MSKIILAAALALSAFAATGCANTIRGAGQDTANTVDATQGAVENTAEAITD